MLQVLERAKCVGCGEEVAKKYATLQIVSLEGRGDDPGDSHELSELHCLHPDNAFTYGVVCTRCLEGKGRVCSRYVTQEVAVNRHTRCCSHSQW